MGLRLAGVVLGAALVWAAAARAQDMPIGAGLWQHLHDGAALTGDWGGRRSGLRERGIDLAAIYTGDVLGVAAGGVRRRAEYLGNLDLMLTVDAERLAGWPGLGLYVYGVGDHGGSPSENVGDVQAVDNIDVPGAFTLLEAWAQQRLWNDRLSLLAGLYNVNAEFDLLDSASLFLNGAFGMSITFAQSGGNGPSSFPATGLAVRLKGRPTDDAYVQAVAADGVPGDPAHAGGVVVHLGGDDGALLALEAGWRRGARDGDTRPPAKVGLGGWLYTADFARLDPPRPLRRGGGNAGVYALAEWSLWREPEDAAQGLTGFARAGWARPRYNRVQCSFAAGATYTGLLPARDGDTLGVGIAHTVDGPDFRRAERADGQPAPDGETAVELTYAAQLAPWLLVQPDLQVVVDPGADPAAANAVVLGARVGITF